MGYRQVPGTVRDAPPASKVIGAKRNPGYVRDVQPLAELNAVGGSLVESIKNARQKVVFMVIICQQYGDRDYGTSGDHSYPDVRGREGRLKTQRWQWNAARKERVRWHYSNCKSLWGSYW